MCLLAFSLLSNTVDAVTYVTTWNVPKVTVRSLVTRGNYAYLACSNGTLQIADITTPAKPSLIGSAKATSGDIFELKLQGNYAYLAAYTGGMSIMDISDPAKPKQVGFLKTPGAARAIFVQGDFAYIADYHPVHLTIANIKDPAAPTIVSTFTSASGGNDTKGAVRIGDYVYLVYSQGGIMEIVDVSDIKKPVSRKVIPSTGGIGFVLNDTSAYLGVMLQGYKGGPGYRITEYSNPANPTIVQTIKTDERGMWIKIWGQYALLCDGMSGFKIMDISNLATPKEVFTYDTPGTARGVDVSGKHAYVADGDKGMLVFDISDLTPPATKKDGDAPKLEENKTKTKDDTKK
jgi:hypothetical protein